jgi:2-keto-3-deoxy-6-phosphogluconate aldolase
MESYNKSILEYSDIADAVQYASERKSIQIAKRCIQKGMSIIEIADLTDLPIEKVKEILKDMQNN